MKLTKFEKKFYTKGLSDDFSCDEMTWWEINEKIKKGKLNDR